MKYQSSIKAFLQLLFILLSISISGQNVGINTNNPESDLHIKTDSTAISLRLDSKIPVNGTKYGSAVFAPSSVLAQPNAYCGAFCTGWINPFPSTLESLDGSFMEIDNSLPPILATEGLLILFQGNPNFPPNSIITAIAFQIDYQVEEIDPGVTFSTGQDLPTYSTGGGSGESLPVLEFSSPGSKTIQIGDDGLLLDPSILVGGLSLDIAYLVNVDPSKQGIVKIDRVRLKVDYSYPTLVPETTTWKMNVEEDKLIIKNKDNPYLSVSSNGEVNISKIKMSPNSENGSVLTSSKNGVGTWQSLPTNSDLDWRNIDDTLTALPYPLRSTESAIFEKDIQVGYTNEVAPGAIRYNPTKNTFEGYNGTKWLNFTATNTGWGSIDGTEQQAEVGVDSLLGSSADISGSFAVASSDSSIYFYEYDTDSDSWSEDTNFDFDAKVFDVAIDGNYAIVTYGVKNIRIYFHDGSTWTEQFNYVGLANFGGYSVDIYGIRAVAVMKENNSCYVYIRSGSSWSVEDSFDIPVSYSGGSSCSIRPTKLLIGKPQETFSIHGVVHYYERNGSDWTLESSINHPNPEPNYPFGTGSLFGYDVEIVQNIAIIGAPRTSAYQGSEFVYKLVNGNWVMQQELTPTTRASNDRYGASVSLTPLQTFLAVGSPGLDGLNSTSSAYLYELVGGTYQEVAKLTPSYPEDYSHFGSGIGLTNNALIIGSELFGNGNEGKVYFFKNN